VSGADKLHELEPPPDARAQGGHEVLRCFVVDGGLSVALRRSFDEPGTWGVLLADLARHAAHVYAKEAGIDEAEAREDMRAAFERELERPANFDTTSAMN
jgi:hypothetical protein